VVSDLFVISPARGICVLLALALSACATRVPSAPVLPSDPDARLAAVRAREERIQSLRARFSSVTRLPGAERSADGVLLVAKPDRFRLRLLLPFGLTVFDYLNVGEQTWTALPLADPQQRDRAVEFAPFSRDDLGQAFLRGPFAFPGQCAAARAGGETVQVTCHDGGAVRRTLLIGTDGIVEETSYEAGAPRLRIRYADYRAVDAVMLPFRITLEYAQRQQSVDITIDRYEVNPTLSDDLFQPPPDSEPRRHTERRTPNALTLQWRRASRPQCLSKRRSGALRAPDGRDARPTAEEQSPANA
jgi:outer membrane lipoprotein-sorting protein